MSQLLLMSEEAVSTDLSTTRSALSVSNRELLLGVVDWMKYQSGPNFMCHKGPGHLKMICCLPYILNCASQDGQIPRSILDPRKPMLIMAMDEDCVPCLESSLGTEHEIQQTALLTELGFISSSEKKQRPSYSTFFIRNEFDAMWFQVAPTASTDIVLTSYSYCSYLPRDSFSVVLVLGKHKLSLTEELRIKSKFEQHSKIIQFVDPQLDGPTNEESTSRYLSNFRGSEDSISADNSSRSTNLMGKIKIDGQPTFKFYKLRRYHPHPEQLQKCVSWESRPQILPENINGGTETISPADKVDSELYHFNSTQKTIEGEVGVKDAEQDSENAKVREKLLSCDRYDNIITDITVINSETGLIELPSSHATESNESTREHHDHTEVNYQNTAHEILPESSSTANSNENALGNGSISLTDSDKKDIDSVKQDSISTGQQSTSHHSLSSMLGNRELVTSQPNTLVMATEFGGRLPEMLEQDECGEKDGNHLVTNDSCTGNLKDAGFEKINEYSSLAEEITAAQHTNISKLQDGSEQNNSENYGQWMKPELQSASGSEPDYELELQQDSQVKSQQDSKLKIQQDSEQELQGDSKLESREDSKLEPQGDSEQGSENNDSIRLAKEHQSHDSYANAVTAIQPETGTNENNLSLDTEFDHSFMNEDHHCTEVTDTNTIHEKLSELSDNTAGKENNKDNDSKTFIDIDKGNADGRDTSSLKKNSHSKRMVKHNVIQQQVHAEKDDCHRKRNDSKNNCTAILEDTGFEKRQYLSSSEERTVIQDINTSNHDSSSKQNGKWLKQVQVTEFEQGSETDSEINSKSNQDCQLETVTNVSTLPKLDNKTGSEIKGTTLAKQDSESGSETNTTALEQSCWLEPKVKDSAVSSTGSPSTPKISGTTELEPVSKYGPEVIRGIELEEDCQIEPEVNATTVLKQERKHGPETGGIESAEDCQLPEVNGTIEESKYKQNTGGLELEEDCQIEPEVNDTAVLEEESKYGPEVMGGIELEEDCQLEPDTTVLKPESEYGPETGGIELEEDCQLEPEVNDTTVLKQKSEYGPETGGTELEEDCQLEPEVNGTIALEQESKYEPDNGGKPEVSGTTRLDEFSESKRGFITSEQVSQSSLEMKGTGMLRNNGQGLVKDGCKRSEQNLSDTDSQLEPRNNKATVLKLDNPSMATRQPSQTLSTQEVNSSELAGHDESNDNANMEHGVVIKKISLTDNTNDKDDPMIMEHNSTDCETQVKREDGDTPGYNNTTLTDTNNEMSGLLSGIGAPQDTIELITPGADKKHENMSADVSHQTTTQQQTIKQPDADTVKGDSSSDIDFNDTHQNSAEVLKNLDFSKMAKIGMNSDQKMISQDIKDNFSSEFYEPKEDLEHEIEPKNGKHAAKIKQYPLEPGKQVVNTELTCEVDTGPVDDHTLELGQQDHGYNPPTHNTASPQKGEAESETSKTSFPKQTSTCEHNSNSTLDRNIASLQNLKDSSNIKTSTHSSMLQQEEDDYNNSTHSLFRPEVESECEAGPLHDSDDMFEKDTLSTSRPETEWATPAHDDASEIIAADNTTDEIEPECRYNEDSNQELKWDNLDNFQEQNNSSEHKVPSASQENQEQIASCEHKDMLWDNKDKNEEWNISSKNTAKFSDHRERSPELNIKSSNHQKTNSEVNTKSSDHQEKSPVLNIRPKTKDLSLDYRDKIDENNISSKRKVKSSDTKKMTIQELNTSSDNKIGSSLSYTTEEKVEIECVMTTADDANATGIPLSTANQELTAQAEQTTALHKHQDSLESLTHSPVGTLLQAESKPHIFSASAKDLTTPTSNQTIDSEESVQRSKSGTDSAQSLSSVSKSRVLLVLSLPVLAATGLPRATNVSSHSDKVLIKPSFEALSGTNLDNANQGKTSTSLTEKPKELDHSSQSCPNYPAVPDDKPSDSSLYQETSFEVPSSHSNNSYHCYNTPI